MISRCRGWERSAFDLFESDHEYYWVRDFFWKGNDDPWFVILSSNGLSGPSLTQKGDIYDISCDLSLILGLGFWGVLRSHLIIVEITHRSSLWSHLGTVYHLIRYFRYHVCYISRLSKFLLYFHSSKKYPLPWTITFVASQKHIRCLHYLALC